MDQLGTKDQDKKKVYQLNTFPVPAPLRDNQENITITTKTSSKPSKEQLINQAFKFHSQGNISEAEKYYQHFINQGFKDHRVFSNYGDILKNLGKLKEAELATRKAIEMKPHLSEVHSNLGNILKDLGKLKEAELATRKAIQLNPNFAYAHSNLGNILIDLGKLKEAELATRKAIQLNPDLAEAHYNLGIILSDLGKLKKAELATRKAIQINPDYAEAHSNLGIILSDLGKLKEAELATRKAIQLNPDLAEAHSNLGIILSDLGKSQESFDSFMRVIEINPTYSNIYSFITQFLRDSDPSQLNKSKLKNILHLLLEKNDVPHKELIRAFNFVYSNEIISNLEKFDSDFSQIELLVNDKLIINTLKKINLKDIRIEKVLTKIRRNICHNVAKNIETINDSQLQFIIALGEQCFLNEYVYSSTEEENISVDNIIKKCIDGEVNEINISLLSCYLPLYKLFDQIPSLKSFHSSTKSFKGLIELQITQPLIELDLSKKIKKIGEIDDDISQKVKSQYEENPYPRWRYTNHSESLSLSTLQAINIEIKPNYISQTLGDDQLQILIAGCGTGNQILQAKRYRNSQLTAIDLSLSSLSYAQRKINELEIDNVELIQMDILEVALLEMKFDIIECGGVLHHMDDPSKGLKALLEVLKNNGFLKLGLYSELARKDIVEARKYITTKHLQINDENIKDFRKDVFSAKIDQISNLSNWGNFYTMSECRDLCFHTQEHRFTIQQLQETLQSNQLKFLGFLLPKQIKSVYEQYFPEDTAQTNLQNWATFEEKHPNTFAGMYQFWVQKMNT